MLQTLAWKSAPNLTRDCDAVAESAATCPISGVEIGAEPYEGLRPCNRRLTPGDDQRGNRRRTLRGIATAMAIRAAAAPTAQWNSAPNLTRDCDNWLGFLGIHRDFVEIGAEPHEGLRRDQGVLPGRSATPWPVKTGSGST